jgi:hypothetical protein
MSQSLISLFFKEGFLRSKAAMDILAMCQNEAMYRKLAMVCPTAYLCNN